MRKLREDPLEEVSMRFPGRGMGWKEFGVALKNEANRDMITDWAGAVTYSGVMALFPFLLFLVALASLVVTPDQAEQIVQQLGTVAPQNVTQILGDRIRAIASDSKTGLLTLGAAVALWSASSGVSEVQRALNIIYGVQEGRPFWKSRGIALFMTLVAGVVALVAGLVAVAAGPIGDAIGGPLGMALAWLRLPVAGLLMMLLWALLYYVLPDVEQKFRFITPGSVLGVIVWVLASWGFSKYVANFGKYDATYGSVGGAIVMLLWMWLSSLVLLLGAEVNAVIEHKSAEGKRAGAKRLSDAGVSGTKTEEVPHGPALAFAQGESAGRAAASARGRALAGLAALVGAALWLRQRRA
jgi:membrane protein